MQTDEELVAGADSAYDLANTYEDYLDSQISPIDLFYLEVRGRAHSNLGQRASETTC